MRSKLRAFHKKKTIFSGKLIRFSGKKGSGKVTSVALLKDLRIAGVLVADHVWLPKRYFQNWMLNADLMFQGKVIEYRKDFVTDNPDRCIDYTITSIKILFAEKPDLSAEEQGVITDGTSL